MTVSEQDRFDGKKIAWLVPLVQPGSGGLQTIFRHVSHLQDLGAECHVVGCFHQGSDNAYFMRKILQSSYQCDPDKVLDELPQNEEYDAAIATFNATVECLFALKAKQRVYFVQDYEPFFYPVGNQYIKTEGTYRKDVPIITIGRWLAHKLYESHGLRARHTSFGADQSLYYPMNCVRERSVCAIFQPEKPRRCHELVAETFELIHMLDKDIKLVAYGSGEKYPFDVPVDNRGLLTKQDCNKLYNECMVGLCISTTNPSRIPFEMMASGLPVVDVYGDNTVWDFSDKATTLAAPDAASLATAIVSLINSPTHLSNLSKSGLEFMSSRSGFVEQEDFARELLNIVNGSDDDLSVAKMYSAPAIEASEEVRALHDAVRGARMRKALTPPAAISTSRYIKVEICNPTEADSSAGIYVIAVSEDSPVLQQEYYEAYKSGAGSFVAQIDTCDFDERYGLFSISVCRKAHGDNPSYQIAEHSVRVASSDDAGTIVPDKEVSYSSKAGRVLTLSFGDKPFVKNVKTLVKYVLNPEDVKRLKERAIRFR